MGREPTSLSCHTCRRRRVACDKRRPSCGQCLKSRFQCQGYEKVLRIQQHGVAQNQDQSFSKLILIKQPTSYPNPGGYSDKPSNSPLLGHEKLPGVASCHQNSPKTSDSKRRVRLKKISSSQRPEQHTNPIISKLQPDLSPNLSLYPFLDNITFSYFFEAYGWINLHSIFLQNSPMRQHLGQPEDSFSSESLRALAYGVYGRDHALDDLRVSSARLYGRVLRQLQSELDNPSKRDLASLIGPIAILGSYSIVVDADLKFSHHDGLARILEYCGPEEFRTKRLLPVFESCRFTMIANSIVRRRSTFLEQERWKTIPWSLSASKSESSKLLDIIAQIPHFIQTTDEILDERSQCFLRHSNTPRKETASTVPDLWLRLNSFAEQLEGWRSYWLSHNHLASDILHWALLGLGDDTYRPGIHGAFGPDVYELQMERALDPDYTFYDISNRLEANLVSFGLMQDAALYITALIWGSRLRKNISGAARAPDAVDFYNSPFHSDCFCYKGTGACQVFPDPSDRVDPAFAWNLTTALISESPLRSLSIDHRSTETRKDRYEYSTTNSPTTPSTSSIPSPLLPGDIRFSAQLRILNWLIRHLPDSRSHVLGTLAAMGLSHCVHDVRPLEGNELIADAVRQTMASSTFKEAPEVLLRKYR